MDPWMKWSFWALWGTFGHFWALLGTFGHFGALWGTLGHFGTLWDTLGHLLSITQIKLTKCLVWYLRHCHLCNKSGCLDEVELSNISPDIKQVALCVTLWYFVALCGSLWQFEHFGTLWDILGHLLSTTQTKLTKYFRLCHLCNKSQMDPWTKWSFLIFHQILNKKKVSKYLLFDQQAVWVLKWKIFQQKATYS